MRRSPRQAKAEEEGRSRGARARRQDPAPGMKDPRVVAVRKRLDIAGDKDNPLYDDAVLEAVKTFQTEADIDRRRHAGSQHRARHERRKATAVAVRRSIRSTSSSPTWSAGAGCRAISARPT